MDTKKVCFIGLYIIGVTVVENLVCSHEIKDDRKIIRNKYTFKRSHPISTKYNHGNKYPGVGQSNDELERHLTIKRSRKNKKALRNSSVIAMKYKSGKNRKRNIFNATASIGNATNTNSPFNLVVKSDTNTTSNTKIFKNSSTDDTNPFQGIVFVKEKVSNLTISTRDVMDIKVNTTDIDWPPFIEESIKGYINRGISSHKNLSALRTQNNVFQMYINPYGNFSRIFKNYTIGESIGGLLKQISHNDLSSTDNTIHQTENGRIKKNNPLRFGIVLPLNASINHKITSGPNTTPPGLQILTPELPITYLGSGTTPLVFETSNITPESNITTVVSQTTTAISETPTSITSEKATVWSSTEIHGNNITTYTATANGTSFITNIFNVPLTIYAFLTGK